MLASITRCFPSAAVRGSWASIDWHQQICPSGVFLLSLKSLLLFLSSLYPQRLFFSEGPSVYNDYPPHTHLGTEWRKKSEKLLMRMIIITRGRSTTASQQISNDEVLCVPKWKSESHTRKAHNFDLLLPTKYFYLFLWTNTSMKTSHPTN